MKENQTQAVISDHDWLILDQVIVGRRDSEIAAILGRTAANVEDEVAQLSKKLSVSDRLSLAIHAVELRVRGSRNLPRRKPNARVDGEQDTRQDCG